MTSQTSNKPTFKVFTVSEPADKSQDAFWCRIGSAFPNAKGMTILLNALPITPRLVLLPITEDEANPKEES